MKKTIIYFLSILLLLSCNNQQKTENNKNNNKQKIEAKFFKPVNYTETIYASGIISSKQELKLSFKTGGIIDKIFVTEGDYVKNGQILAKLKLDEISAKVNQAKLALDKAKRDFDRAKSLYNDSVATLEQFQNAKSALDFAKTNMQIADFNLKHSIIYAPSNGKILKIISKENEITGPGYPVFYFGSKIQEWVTKVNITDKDIIKIKLGDTAKIFTDAYPDTFFTATVSEIAKMADPYTGTFVCELQILNKTKKLITGFIVSAKIKTSRTQKVFKLPYSALIEIDNKTGYIYLLKNNKQIKTKVKIIKINDNNILVTGKELSKYKIITNS
jgi:RND family efflux transporter MFP subunit